MISQEENEICYLCNETFFVENMNYFCNEFDEDGKEIYLCQNCYYSGKCDKCDTIIYNINDLIYLIDNFKCIDTCVICLLNQYKEKECQTCKCLVNKPNINNEKKVEISKPDVYENTYNNDSQGNNKPFVNKQNIPFIPSLKYIEKNKKYHENINKIELYNTFNKKHWKEYEYSVIKYDDYIINNYDYYYINKYKNEEIIKNTKIKRNKYKKSDQVQVVNKVLDKILKSRKVGNKRISEVYKLRKEKNNATIKLYSYLYNNKTNMDNDIFNDILKEEKISKSNESRFNKYSKILDKIYKNKLIYESEFLFLPGTFCDVNDESIDFLINNIELLCKNPENIKDIKNTIKDKSNILVFSEIDNNLIKTVSDNNGEIHFPCKNSDCIDTAFKLNTFCDGCTKDLKNNILYECKNPNCDDDEVVNENDYCNYCKKDIKMCKLCNTEFVNDELDVNNCEDCSESMEMERYYED